MAVRTDNEARALLDRVAGLSQQLRDNCGRFDWLGDEDSCANSADEIDAFIGTRAPGLLTRSEDGDDDAHGRLVSWSHKMLDFLRTAYGDISQGTTFSDIAGEVAADIEKKAKAAASFALPAGVLIVIALVAIAVIKVK